MAEDENVDVLSMDTELAERLGVVVPPAWKGETPRVPGRRSHSTSPGPYPASAKAKARTLAALRGKCAGGGAPRVLADLKPFLHMLPPEVARAEIKDQQTLYKTILDAGMKAYQHLLHYVVVYGSESSLTSVTSVSSAASASATAAGTGASNAPSSPTALAFPPYTTARLASLESELESISMMERIDQAYETLIEVGDAPPTSIAGSPDATPQVAANTLGLFAGAALRRPPTRAVESLMAAAQESAAAHSDMDRQDQLFDATGDADEYGACEDGLISLACSAGFTELTRTLLKIRGDTTFSGETDCTPLMEACAAGAEAVVKCLLDMDADVNILSSTKNTALIYASAAGHEECVRMLLATGKCNIEERNESGHCALMEAASGGHLNIVKMMINAGAKPMFINMNTDFKESPLTLASYKGHVEVVEYLLELTAVSISDEEMHTALMETSMDGHIEVAKVLLDAGAPVNMDSESFESPLTLACCGGHDELAKMLLDAGANIEEPNDESYTPLMEAAREGHATVVQALLERGAQVNAQTEETGETAMTVAACGGYTEVLEVLVQHGGDLELGANTPLMEAAQEGHVATVMYILGASRVENRCPNLQAHSNTALALAAENGHLDVLEVLYTSGADFNLECEGRTPLMKAAKNGYTDIVMYLLNKQANVNHRSSTSDATALSLACASGHKEIVRLLLKAGADPNIVLKDGVTCVLEAARNGYVEIVELMLDHNGVFPQPARPTAANAGPKTPPPSTATTNGTGKPVLAPCRRKKPCPGTATALPNPAKNPTTACHVPPDPCAYNASMLPPAGAAAGSVGYDIFPPVEAYSNPELARAYYAWLANSYNLQQGTNTAMHVPVQLPAGMSAADVLLSVEDIQKMLLTMVPANAGFYQHHMFTAQATVPYNEVTAKELAQLQQSANLLKNTDPSAHHPKSAEVVRVLAKAAAFARESNIPLDTLFETAFSQINYDMDPRTLTEAQAKTLNEMGFNFPAHPAASSTASEQTSTTQSQPVPTTSGSYLSNTYENIKKNFAGLPLPAVPVAAPKQKDSTAPVPTTAPSAQPPKTTQVSATQTKPTANTTKTQAAAAGISDAKWEAVVQELTAPMSPEERRVTRKKLQEMFGANCNAPPDVASLKSFLELFQEWTRMNHATDVNEFQAVLEQQTASITETLKVLRPTVRSLPGGMVASASPPPPAIVPPIPASAPAHSTSATTIPAAATAVSSTPAAAAHRRTHSEGDDIDTPRAPAAQRAAFNVDKATESNNDTPLTLACSNGHKEMVSVLVSRGANIEHRDKKGFTPLILAATGGHMGVVEALINANANIEAQSERTKDTALSLACSGGRKEVVELLLNKGANKEHRNVSDYTPLSLAASGGYVEIVNMLLNNGAEINSRTGSKLGISPLMLAAMNGHKDATRVLLEKGSDINAQIETNRNTALTLACFQGRTDVVRLLLQYHANVEHRAKTGLTPLMEAANGGYVEVGELLLEHYADPNTTPVPSSRDTALTIAADKGHEKFVEMLVHRGAAIDSRNKKGCTALWLACHGGHLETVQTLVKHHADVDAQDNRKVSPLMVAFRKGHTKVVKCMVNHVKQFPNDQEMARYMSTIGPSTDTPSKEMQDLFVNCNECMTIIVKAKNAQAEQADKAAESLLALLAEEEEQARSKKQKKQKKKEEKKAKKAKKTDVNEPESTPPPPSPAPKKAPAVTKPSSPAPVPVVAPPTNGKEESEDCSDDESESLSVSVAKVAEPPKVQDDRVPMTAATVPEDVLVVPEKITGLSSRQKRQNNRRSRNDSGKLAPTEVTTSTHSGGSLTVQASPKSVISGVIVPKASPQSDEWVNASKRKQSSKSRAGAPTITVGLTAAQKEYFLDENGAFTGWKDVELARRRSNTLSVSSNVIARVIGRGGANINAIREATGASIEVEKQNARKDQHDRQICIRGTGEIVKNATLMINGLIADNETTVNDIIRQVLRGNTSVASSSSESGSRLGSVCQETAKTTAPVGGSGATKAPAPVTPAPPPSTGNVWQQRMAARQQQMQKTVPKEECSPPPSAATIVVPAPSSPIPSAVTVQAPLELAQPTTVAVAPAAPVREPSPPAEVPVSSPTLISTIAAESELNKAPGYRPQATAQAAVSKVAAAPSPPPPAVESREVQPPKSISPVQNHNIFAAPIDVPAPMSRANDGSDSMLAPNQEGNNLSFLDQTTHAKLAQIWGSGGDDSGAHEPAWSSQILLNNFGNMNLSGNSAAEWSTSTDPLFMGGLPQAPSSPPRQPTSSAMGGPTSFNGPTHDWMSSPTNKGSTPLYGRTAQSQQHRRNLMMSPHQPAPVTVSSHQQQRQMTSSGAPPPESNLLFNQLAAQLLTHQGSGTAPPHSGGQSGQSFYPPSSASYSDPSMGGPMSSQQSAVHKSYAASYQSAAQEYENLHNLLSSYNHSHHSQGNGEFNGTSGGFPQSSSAPRTILGARAPGASYAPPPPPGFGGVAPPSLGANTNMPPPPPTMSMRSFFNNQMPPPAPSAFNAYSPLNNGTWSQAKSNPGSQPPHSQQQMPWSGGWN